jgi:hypothetical protein
MNCCSLGEEIGPLRNWGGRERRESLRKIVRRRSAPWRAHHTSRLPCTRESVCPLEARSSKPCRCLTQGIGSAGTWGQATGHRCPTPARGTGGSSQRGRGPGGFSSSAPPCAACNARTTRRPRVAPSMGAKTHKTQRIMEGYRAWLHPSSARRRRRLGMSRGYEGSSDGCTSRASRYVGQRRFWRLSQLMNSASQRRHVVIPAYVVRARGFHRRCPGV